MKTWLSAAEIAALRLPGLPARRESVIRLAARAAWRSRPRAGRGGGAEYPIDVLPIDARADYVARMVETVAIPPSLARPQPPAVEDRNDNAVRPEARAALARDARLAVLALAERFGAETTMLSVKRADRHFCARWNAGQVAAARWITTEVKHVTPRTIARWREAVRRGERDKLAVDRGQARKGTGMLDRANDGAVKTYILALIAKQPHLTAHHVRALVADRFGVLTQSESTIAIPPVRTFQHVLKVWRAEHRVALESIRNPDGFKSTMRFAARVAQPAQRLNEVWQIDASPADALCLDGRHALYVCEDIHTRRLIALVSKTPRASAVGLLVRKAILDWGVPERIKSDNGSDFIARDTQRLFAALGIEHETARAFSPEQKGHIERAIGTLQRGLMRTLPGFVGHSVADRKVIEGRKSFAARLGETPEDAFEVSLTAAELQRHVDNWCATVYAHRSHAGLDGQTPFAVAATSAERVRRIGDPRALDMLLAPVAGKDGLRTVTKTGLRIDGAHYIGGFLDVGATVLVRMDEADMGRVYVFSEDGLKFLGEAIAPELAGVDPAAAIAAARAAQKQKIDDAMADVRREARRIKAKDFAPAILRQALKDAGKLAEFPKASDAHATPALDAAAIAVAGASAEPEHSAEVIALHERLLAERPDAAERQVPHDETAHHRWTRAQKLAAALAAGEPVGADDLMWLGGYRDGPEYRGFALTYGESPAAARG